MGYICIVPYCKTGYPSEKAKQTRLYSLFRTPQQDAERLRQWEQNIPSNIKLKNTHRVCEKHFTDDCIVRKRIIIYKDIPNQEVLLAKPFLTKTAVPTIFPNCPGYLNTHIIISKEPSVRKPLIKIEEPLIKTEELLIEIEEPLIEIEEPLIKIEDPLIKIEKPSNEIIEDSELVQTHLVNHNRVADNDESLQLYY